MHQTTSKVVVTGGAGFIGSHLVDHLLESTRAEVVVLDNLHRGRLANLGASEQRCGADCGTRFAKSQLIGIHHTKMKEAEVAYRPGGGADVEGIAGTDKYDAQAVEFALGRQGRRVYSRREVMK